jgi:hypothetical protein
MTEFPTIQATVKFRDTRSGGRKLPPIDSLQYRPHIVIGDPDQKEALFEADGRTLTEEYLGVVFTGDGRTLELGKEWIVGMRLFHLEGGYSDLVPGVTFTIREGGVIVGSGTVNDHLSPEGD